MRLCVKNFTVISFNKSDIIFASSGINEDHKFTFLLIQKILEKKPTIDL